VTTVIRVRRETAGDVAAIRRVHDLAFGARDSVLSWEARLVEDLRGGPSWIPALSMVAEIDGVVVGHVLATRGRLDAAGSTRAVRALGLAPLGVVPDRQHLGIGTRLMYALLGAARALDHEIVCLLGDPAYYGRFGFVRSSTLGIAPPHPTWAAHFQALLLDPQAWDGTPGTFWYDPAFDREP
jgi:putative acetyltransferase